MTMILYVLSNNFCIILCIMIIMQVNRTSFTLLHYTFTYPARVFVLIHIMTTQCHAKLTRCSLLYFFISVTLMPTVSLINSTLQSLSISWSVTSPQDVTNYMVFWWKESAEISKSVSLDDTKFVIEGLLSNTAYQVVVVASGPLGNVNSTSVFYTTPKEVQGDST